jgi:hypothetical protein
MISKPARVRVFLCALPRLALRPNRERSMLASDAVVVAVALVDIYERMWV